MDIFTELGVVLKFEGNDVFINIYPDTDILVNITRDTALHIFKLGQKYNYTRIDPKKWSGFWIKVTQIERTMTVILTEKSNPLKKQFGSFPFKILNPEDLPKDFREITTSTRLPKITPAIKDELEAIYDIHIKTVVSPEEVRDYWEKTYPDTYNLLKRNNQLEKLVEACFEENKIQEIIGNALVAQGKTAFEKPEWCEEYTDDIFRSLIRNEVSLFSGTPYRLAGWKL